MIISIDRASLLKRLGDVLKEAHAEDKRVEIEHEKDEQAALKKFREKLREALKWDYKRAKQGSNGRYAERIEIDAPSCPRCKAPDIQIAINQVTMDTRKSERFNVSPGTDIYAALMWIPPSKEMKKTVCDSA